MHFKPAGQGRDAERLDLQAGQVVLNRQLKRANEWRLAKVNALAIAVEANRNPALAIDDRRASGAKRVAVGNQ